MPRITLIVMLVLSLAAGLVLAQDEPAVQEAETAVAAPEAPAQDVQVDISFGTEVDRTTRTLVGAAGSFPAEVGQVYCYTHLTGLKAPALVTHAWYHEGRTMAKVELNVGSADWRTWSSKQVLPGWKGQWEVKVLDAGGKVLGSADFELQ